MSNICRKNLFNLPEGVTYLDGNSLGPLPKAVNSRLANMISNEWGEQLIRGWNDAGWMEQPSRVGNKVAKLIGAPDGSVVLGDTLSIKVYQALAAGIEMRPDRKVILSDNGNFPTDLYMAEGLIKALKQGHRLKVVSPDEVEAAIDETIAVVMLTEVDYRTGRKHDMAEITSVAHENGAVMMWDLAHSAGALPVDLIGSKCEFAVGCTYKYLNGGPGAPAFIYVRPDLIDNVQPALSGWLGHAAPFAFEQTYRAGNAIERMRVGTPPVMQLTALETALEVWEGVEMAEVRSESLRLCDLFIELVEAKCPDLKLASPRTHDNRGSQVSFSFEHGYAAMQALISLGVIGDFRAPDIMRFGVTPLYIDDSDIERASDLVKKVMDEELWKKPEFNQVNRVT